jgi:hypothetical protein
MNHSPNKDFGLDGKIIYWDRVSKMYSLIGGNPLTKEKLAFPTSYNIDLIGFSPKGDKLLFVSREIFLGKTSKLYIFNHDQEEVIDIQPPDFSIPAVRNDGIYPDINWINNDLLLVRVYHPTDNNPTSSFLAILNITNGRWENQYFSEIPQNEVTNGMSFSPNLSRAVSISTDGVFIWDVVNRKYIQRISNIVGYQQVVSWSPDGESFALIGIDTNNGKLKSLGDGYYDAFIINVKTSFIEQITDYQAIFRLFYPGSLTWSINGDQLAFTAFISIAGETPRQVLFLYDLDEQGSRPFCWQYGGPLNTTTNKLIWSPDNHFIAYADYYDNDSQKLTPLYVIDLLDGSVNQIADSAKDIGGWSIKFN